MSKVILDPDLTQADCDLLSDEGLVETLLVKKDLIGLCCNVVNELHRDAKEASKTYAGTWQEWMESGHQAGRDLRTAKAAILSRLKVR